MIRQVVFLSFVVLGIGVSGPLADIQNIVTIIMENWSFDGLAGTFAGVDGLAYAVFDSIGLPQVDVNGTVLTKLPPVPLNATANDPRFPLDLPNAPFNLGKYMKFNEEVFDCVHKYYINIEQINGGLNNKFAAWADCAGSALGYWDMRGTLLEELAKNYTLCNRFFQSAFGGSYLSHQWAVCACTPKFDNAPANIRTVLNSKGGINTRADDKLVTPDGYTVNTIYTKQTPHPATTPTAELTDPFTEPTIGDRLTEKGVSWKWYSGGWNNASSGKPDPDFQFHHQAFAYYKTFADNTTQRADHLKDEDDFWNDLKSGKLPQVTWLKPIGQKTLHRGYSVSYDPMSVGMDWMTKVLDGLKKSPQYSKMLIILTWDEAGGMWDHVPPPKGDRWGPGTRIPTFIIGPNVKRGFVDNTMYDGTSILKTIENRFDIAPLTSRDAAANDLSNALQTPTQYNIVFNNGNI